MLLKEFRESPDAQFERITQLLLDHGVSDASLSSLATFEIVQRMTGKSRQIRPISDYLDWLPGFRDGDFDMAQQIHNDILTCRSDTRARAC